MSVATGCECPCPTPVVTEVPGSPGTPGADGADGADGISAFSPLAADLQIPGAAGPTGVVDISVTSWMALGEVIFISDGTNMGHFQVLTIPSSSTATLQYLDYPGDTPGGLIATGPAGVVTPSGVLAALSAALPNSITDNSTGTASDTIAIGAATVVLEFPHTFIGGTAAVEPVTTHVVGFKFKIMSWAFVTETLLVGAAGSRVANMEINAVDVGTVVSTCTVAIAAATVGTVTPGTAVAGANTGSATDSFSIEIANGGTQFTAGSGTFIVNVLNMDLADAIKSLSTHTNDLITALT